MLVSFVPKPKMASPITTSSVLTTLVNSIVNTTMWLSTLRMVAPLPVGGCGRLDDLIQSTIRSSEIPLFSEVGARNHTREAGRSGISFGTN